MTSRVIRRVVLAGGGHTPELSVTLTTGYEAAEGLWVVQVTKLGSAVRPLSFPPLHPIVRHGG